MAPAIALDTECSRGMVIMCSRAGCSRSLSTVDLRVQHHAHHLGMSARD